MTNILRYDKMGKLINVGILSLYYTSRQMGNIIQPIIKYHIALGTLIKVGKAEFTRQREKMGCNPKCQNIPKSCFVNDHSSQYSIDQQLGGFTVGTSITIITIKWEKNRAGSVNHELLIGLHRKLILNHHNVQASILI